MVTKICMMISVLCSYSIYIFPCNTIIESWIIKDNSKSCKKTWITNFSRFLVLISAILAAVFLADKMDKACGLMGALFCAPLALFFPALLHRKICAKTMSEKAFDSFFIIVSIVLLIYCVSDTLLRW